MEKQILQVKQFQDAFVDREMPMKPTMPPAEIIELRQKLLEEEVKEIRDAETLVEMADGIVDAMYILIGTAHEIGIADRLIMLFDEVHRSNMSKLPEDGVPILREDGKVIKPDTYSPPNLEKIMERDFALYRSLSEEAQALEAREKILLEQKVLRKIKSILKKHDPLSLRKLNDYLKSEEELSKVFKVTYAGGGINERYAMIDACGYQHIVKLDFSAPKVGGVKKEKKPTKKQQNSKLKKDGISA